MTAILKVDTIQDTSGNNIINESSDTITIGAAGDTVTVPGTEVKSNKLSPASGTALQIGDSGDTITIPSGATIANSGTATGFGGTMTPAFQARLSGNYTLANNTQTVLPLDTDNSSPKSFDTNGAFDTSTYKFTVPSGQGGKYFLYATARWDEPIASDRCNIGILRNGSGLSIEGEHQGAHQYFTVSASGAAVLSAGDYVTLTAFQDSGSSKTVRSDVTFLGGYKIIE